MVRIVYASFRACVDDAKLGRALVTADDVLEE